jgi:hypothetical protein
MENRNGGANRRLAGGERRVVLTSALGKEMAVGEKSPANVSFYRGRRERERATAVTHVGVGRPTACRSGGNAACVTPLSPCR